MKNWLKYTLIAVAVLGLFIIVIPLLLNWLLLNESQFDIVGNSNDWLQFWPVYLSAIGTTAMAVVTLYTLQVNQKQMTSIVESEGAQLVFSLYKDFEYVWLKVTNVGRSVAKNIHLSIPNNRLAILERNAGLPFGEGLINHFDNLTPIPLLLPNQSEYIPLYMYRALNDSIKEKNGIKIVEMFGDNYSPENITEIGEYFKKEKFTITGYFINYLNQKHLTSQEVDNTYNVSLAEENNSFEPHLRELNKNLIGIKRELHTLDIAKLKDIYAVLEKERAELHSIADNLKKIESKIKK